MKAQLSALLLLIEAAAAQRVVSVPFQKRASTAQPHPLSKRAGYFSATLNNYIPLSEYFATVEVGTPPQTLELVIDTGSSDVWFFGVGACDVNAAGGACEGGEYDSSKSSTYKLLAQGEFQIQYETQGSGVVGDYIADTFSIGGMSLTNLTMAVATQANQTQTGIMGIALDTDESIAHVQNSPGIYQNLPDTLVKQGKIGSKSYSLYLNDLAASTGTVIFGGYDTAKFTGDLVMLPLQNDSQTGIIDSFAVAWTGLALTTSNGTSRLEQPSDLPGAAILDSGTTLTYLPQDLFVTLAEAFNAQYDKEAQTYLVDCNIGSETGSVDYSFGGNAGVTISVPFGELAIPAYGLNGERETLTNGDPACVFGLQPNQPSNPVLFGQSFLRSAYVMYDLDNLRAGLAPTVFDATTSNIVEYSASNSAQASVTLDTSGPTITIASAADNPGNPFSEFFGSSMINTNDYGGYGGYASSGPPVSVSTGPVAYTRSYPHDSVPTREPSSLLPISGTVAAANTAAGGSTGSASGAAATSSKGAAMPVAAPAPVSVFGYVAACVTLMSIVGGMLLL